MSYTNLEKNILISVFVLSKLNLLLDLNERILTNYLMYICVHLYLVKFSNHIYNNYIKSSNIEKYNYYLDITADTNTEFIENINYLEMIKEPAKSSQEEINFNNIDLIKSKIIKCKIVNKENKIISLAVKYRKILIDIWKSESNKDDIINKNKLFKFLDVEETDKTDFNYCKEIDLWFRNNSSNISFKQIRENIKKNDYKIDISIKLENDRIIHYNY